MTAPLPLVAGAVTAALIVVVGTPQRPGRRAHRALGPSQRRRTSIPRLPKRQVSALPGASGRRAGQIAVVVLATVLVSPSAAALLGAGIWSWGRHRAAVARRAAARAVADALPDTVDLLLLATSAGLSLPLAHPLVAARVGTPLGEALRGAAIEADRGRPRADALVAALAPLGDRALTLAHLLADHLRYGVALAPRLERLGDELRTDRRHRAEQDARRVPVRLLGPLIACVLPAFGLLTVVPLLAASLRDLPT